MGGAVVALGSITNYGICEWGELPGCRIGDSGIAQGEGDSPGLVIAQDRAGIEEALPILAPVGHDLMAIDDETPLRTAPTGLPVRERDSFCSAVVDEDDASDLSRRDDTMPDLQGEVLILGRMIQKGPGVGAMVGLGIGGAIVSQAAGQDAEASHQRSSYA